MINKQDPSAGMVDSANLKFAGIGRERSSRFLDKIY
jgi:hypothetical protein